MHSWTKPVEVELGVSIAGVCVGMTRAEVEARGLALKPEGIERVDQTGWVSGPLLLLFDPEDRVAVLSLSVHQSRGVIVNGRRVGPRASLAEVSAALPSCELGTGSGGQMLTCKAGTRQMHFYDSFSEPGAVYLHLP